MKIFLEAKMSRTRQERKNARGKRGSRMRWKWSVSNSPWWKRDPKVSFSQNRTGNYQIPVPLDPWETNFLEAKPFIGVREWEGGRARKGVGEGGIERQRERRKKNERIYCQQHSDNENQVSIQRFSLKKVFHHLAVWKSGTYCKKNQHLKLVSFTFFLSFLLVPFQFFWGRKKEESHISPKILADCKYKEKGIPEKYVLPFYRKQKLAFSLVTSPILIFFFNCQWKGNEEQF